MSDYNVKHPKDLKDRAKREGKGNIGMGIDVVSGRYEFSGVIDHGLAEKLWSFAHFVYLGKDPRETFEKFWGSGKPE